jgi:protocatechuate 3,4-dioxygenase beta subunit
MTTPRTVPSVLTAGLTRRRAMRTLGLGLLSLPMIKLAACSDDSGSGDPDAGPGGAIDAAAGDGDAITGGWAMGGTAVMTGIYPDPFASGVDTCTLACETTVGPCYAATIARKDISEGYLGLPVRLALKVVRAGTCEPVEGATVDIWHTQRSGLYSGSDAIDFCTSGDADARSHRYFRGTQVTDADGRVDFNTCFPGWYPGRAIHIHFQVRLGSDEYVTSQLFFDQALITDVFASHAEYQGYGQPDTSNSRDGVIRGRNIADYTVTTARMSDGAMLASKVLSIRSSLSDATC